MRSYFHNRSPLSYLNLTKNYENIHKAPTAQKYFKHQDIKQKEPPQKYRLGTISRTTVIQRSCECCKPVAPKFWRIYNATISRHSYEKVQVGKDQEKAQSEKDSHSKNRGGKTPN